MRSVLARAGHWWLRVLHSDSKWDCPKFLLWIFPAAAGGTQDDFTPHKLFLKNERGKPPGCLCSLCQQQAWQCQNERERGWKRVTGRVSEAERVGRLEKLVGTKQKTRTTKVKNEKEKISKRDWKQQNRETERPAPCAGLASLCLLLRYDNYGPGTRGGKMLRPQWWTMFLSFSQSYTDNFQLLDSIILSVIQFYPQTLENILTFHVSLSGSE